MLDVRLLLRNTYLKHKLDKSKRLNQLEDLKIILKREIQDLKDNIVKIHSKEDEITDRPLSRLADHNDLIRINTLEWVLKIVTKLENRC